ncbi:MAG TPA: hypothetical protein VHD32_03240 [Candidatus Didemnitutus sp.]|nr:hypothetical protein [Candidatus Didemnitutus sp.]
MRRSRPLFCLLLAIVILRDALPNLRAGGETPASDPWLQEASLSVRESYDDNILRVSGLGLPEQGSWVSSVAFNLGVNLLPWIGPRGALHTLSLRYQAEASAYASAPSENNIAHRWEAAGAGRLGDLNFSAEDSLLIVDGERRATTYALNESTGAEANQNDRFRNNYAHPYARDRRSQMQDRASAKMQVDHGPIFARAVAALSFYDFHTDLFNNSAVPYRGYQDYLNCYDLNGGMDAGWHLPRGFDLVAGYRWGFQHQQRFEPATSADQHFSSNHYQRLLIGLEGKVGAVTTVRIAGGPDFRSYNASAPIDQPRTTRWYGEASMEIAISTTQKLEASFKQWLWVSLNGLIPFEDITSSLTYRWEPAKAWSFEGGARLLRANFTIGNDLAGSAPSWRDDILYQLTLSVTHRITPRWAATLASSVNLGRNNLPNLPPALYPAYRDFDQRVTSLSAEYRF